MKKKETEEEIKITILESEIKEIKNDSKEELEEEHIDSEELEKGDSVEIIEDIETNERTRNTLDHYVSSFNRSEEINQLNSLDDLKSVRQEKSSVDDKVVDNLYSGKTNMDNLYNPNKSDDIEADSFLVQYKENVSMSNEMIYSGNTDNKRKDMSEIYKTTKLDETIYSSKNILS